MGTAASGPSYFSVRLKSREEVAEGTMAFRFEKPAGWIFKAGQSVDLTLLNPPETDSEGNTRAFSIASAPQEDTLMFATRIRDTAFKRTLKTLSLGNTVKVEGPFGNLTLHNNAAKTCVLLAGGIGITPFRSMVVRAAREKLAHRIFLFFSNRRPEDAPFLEELRALEKDNPNYKLIATMTEMSKSKRPWHGETDFVNAGMLSKYLKDAQSPIYYIAGPPTMVKAMREILSKQSVDDDDMRTEEFSGY
jgi:ferredoxin-NADP reductase